MGSRRQARELALQLLYQYELTGAEPEEMERHSESYQHANDDVQAFADALLRGVLSDLGSIDEALSRQTAHWRLERLAAVDRNILRIAIYELMAMQETPAAVIIDEAIEVAKKFGAEESARFVNGVLDGYVKKKVPAR